MIRKDDLAAFVFQYGAALRDLQRLANVERRLFAEPPTAAMLIGLDQHPQLADRIEAFASRFGRLQDLIGDKLLVRLARMLEEEVGSRLELLDRAERPGWIGSADRWLAARKLRNSLVHEYFDSPVEFLEALSSIRAFGPDLRDALGRIRSKVVTLGIVAALPEIDRGVLD